MKRIRGAKSQKDRQYTIRSVPAAVDAALRQRAKQLRRSLNDVAVDALAKGLGMNGDQQVRRNLDDLFGRMKADPAIDQALADQRRVEPEMWR